MDGLSRNGLGPNSRNEIFSFAYFTCAVASEFQNTSIQSAVLKNQSGPKILVVSRSLDRLIASGLIDLYDVPAPASGMPVEGQYLISDRGRAVVEKSIKTSEYLSPIAQFLYDVTYAFGNLSPEEINLATKFDASFSDIEVANGEVVDLGEWQPGNKTTDMLGFLRDYSRRVFSGDPLVACQMYARYLDNKVSVAPLSPNAKEGAFA